MRGSSGDRCPLTCSLTPPPLHVDHYATRKIFLRRAVASQNWQVFPTTIALGKLCANSNPNEPPLISNPPLRPPTRGEQTQSKAYTQAGPSAPRQTDTRPPPHYAKSASPAEKPPTLQKASPTSKIGGMGKSHPLKSRLPNHRLNLAPRHKPLHRAKRNRHHLPTEIPNGNPLGSRAGLSPGSPSTSAAALSKSSTTCRPAHPP